MSIFTKEKKGNTSRCNSISVRLDSKVSPFLSQKKSVEITKERNLQFKGISVKVDSKGRISIPSFLRKNLDVNSGDSLELIFDLSKNFFIVQNATPFFRKEKCKVSKRNYFSKDEI